MHPTLKFRENLKKKTHFGYVRAECDMQKTERKRVESLKARSRPEGQRNSSLEV